MMEELAYEVAGRRFPGLLAGSSTGARAGVLVFHGGSGLTEHERQVVRRLAGLGYAALAPDLFGEVFTDRAHGMGCDARPVRRGPHLIIPRPAESR